MPSELYPKLENLLVDMIGRGCSNTEIISAVGELYHIEVFPRGGKKELYDKISAIKKTLRKKDEK